MKNLRTEVFENDSIRFYSQNAARYASDTMKLDMGEVYPHFLSHIAPGGKILDAGCGSGRDSLYFSRQGYSVTPFDASKEMCKEASKRLRFPVLQMRFEELEYDAVFDGAWACASLVHTPWAKQEPVIRKLLHALKPGGALYAAASATWMKREPQKSSAGWVRSDCWNNGSRSARKAPSRNGSTSSFKKGDCAVCDTNFERMMPSVLEL